jgi:uncharacterized protein DUF5719
VVKGLIINRILPVVAVLAVLAAAAGITMLHHPATLAAGTGVPVPTAAAVDGVERGCPAPGLAGAPIAQVAFIAGPAASSGTGQATVTSLGAVGGKPRLSAAKPGELTEGRVPPSPAQSASASPSPSPSATPAVPSDLVNGGAVIQASGSMARGLDTEQVTASGSSFTPCESPGTDFWFIGPGQATASHIQLYLMNADSQPADVNVEAFTDAGPLQGTADTGIAVAPHTMIVQSLARTLRTSRVVALHVRTSVGQIVAALSESTRAPRGGAWVPVTQEPSTSVVLPGMPPSAGTRQLFVVVPGQQDAHVTVTAVTSKGSYQPTGGGGLDIPATSAVALPLSSLSGIPGAVKVTSNVPITAAMLLPGGGGGMPGVFTVAAPPIQEQGTVAVSQSGAGKESVLVLSAPGRAVSAQIVQIGQGTAPGSPQTVKVEAHHTTVVQLKKAPGTKGRTPYSLVVKPQPGSGPLYAGRVLSTSGNGGVLESIVPVFSALVSVPLPPVRNTLITTSP